VSSWVISSRLAAAGRVQNLRDVPIHTRWTPCNQRSPGAQLTVIDQHHGLPYHNFGTDTLSANCPTSKPDTAPTPASKTASDEPNGQSPSRPFAVNTAWLELALTAIDLIAWTQHLLLDGDPANCEPKALRYRLLHTAARITHGQRRTYLRLVHHWKRTEAWPPRSNDSPRSLIPDTPSPIRRPRSTAYWRPRLASVLTAVGRALFGPGRCTCGSHIGRFAPLPVQAMRPVRLGVAGATSPA
jgi:hypothetical protein